MSGMSRFGGPSATAAVVLRFLLRVGGLSLFAAASHLPFWRVLTTLLLVGAVLCIALAVVRREVPFGDALGHWDEALVLAFLSRASGIVAASAG